MTVALGLAVLALAATPVFFESYRSIAFNTIPHDDYASYLLALVGQGGHVPVPPFIYRVISVAVAIPFYYILPVYTFTNLSNVDPAHLKAIEAMAFASFLWLILTSVVIYHLARRQHGVSRAGALAAGLTSFVLSGLIQRAGVDPFAILVISTALLVIERPSVFGAVVVSSIGINEKIPILFVVVLGFRFARSLVTRTRFRLLPQLVLAAVAVAGYGVVRAAVGASGNDEQTNPMLFIDHLRSTLAYTLSLKGGFLNLVPVVVVLLLALVAHRARGGGSFDSVDISGLIALVLLAGMADVIYNVGRIAMYASPLYLPSAAAIIDELSATPRDSKH